MHLTKIFIGLLWAVLLSAVTVFAGEEITTSKKYSPSDEYRNTELYDFDLEVETDGKKVTLQWEEFDEDNFMWYKFVFSTKDSDPVYPNHDSYYISDDAYTDEYEAWMKPGAYYVRLCAITQDDDSRGRYCSRVKKVEIKEHTTITACTKEYAPVCGKKYTGSWWWYATYDNKCYLKRVGAIYVSSGECKNEDEDDYDDGYEDEDEYDISDETKRKVQNILDNFIAKLERKWYSDDKIVDTLEVVIDRLEKLQDQQKYRELIGYMIDVIEDIIDEYEDDFDAIEDIFSDF